jgi:hypothetical protein
MGSGIHISKTIGQRIVSIIPVEEDNYLTIKGLELENGNTLLFTTDNGEPVNVSIKLKDNSRMMNEATMRIDNRIVKVSTVMVATLGDYTIHDNKLWRITGRTRDGYDTVYILERKDDKCTHVIRPLDKRAKLLFKVYVPSGYIDI